MKSIAEIDQSTIRDLLLRNWMTHDAMWFAQAVTHHGIEAANTMNRAAVRAMAVVEAKRIKRLLGVESVSNGPTLHELFDVAIALVIPDFMAYEMAWAPDSSSAIVRVERCFAHDGVAALDLIDRYECGIFERIYGWLDAFDVTFVVEPDSVHCLAHTQGRCERRLCFSFPGEIGDH